MSDQVIDWVFLIVTGAIAWHGARWRDQEGRPDTVRLFFASIAGLFFALVLFRDILGVVSF